MQDPSSARNAWHTPTSGSDISPTQRQPHPPRPPSSSSSSASSSHRTSHSRSKQRISQGSRQTRAIAAQYPQSNQHLLTETSFLTDSGHGDSLGDSNQQLLYPHSSNSVSSRDLSMSSGVGSSVSSSDYLGQTGRVRGAAYVSSSVSEVIGTPGGGDIKLRRQPDSLPSVSNVASSGNTVAQSQSYRQAISSSTRLQHPKLPLGSGRAPSSR